MNKDIVKVNVKGQRKIWNKDRYMGRAKKINRTIIKSRERKRRRIGSSKEKLEK